MPERHGKLARSRPKSDHGATRHGHLRSPTHESPWSSSSPNHRNSSVIPIFFSVSPGKSSNSHSIGISAPSPPADPNGNQSHSGRTDFQGPALLTLFAHPDYTEDHLSTVPTPAEPLWPTWPGVFFRHVKDELEYLCAATRYVDQQSKRRNLRACTECLGTAMTRNADQHRITIEKCSSPRPQPGDSNT